MNVSVLVGKVDMNGYCGRSPHPEPSMEGNRFPVVSMRVVELGDVSEPFQDYVFTVRVPVSFFTEMSGDERVVTEKGVPSLDIELLPHELHDVSRNWEDAPDVTAGVEP